MPTPEGGVAAVQLSSVTRHEFFYQPRGVECSVAASPAVSDPTRLNLQTYDVLRTLLDSSSYAERWYTNSRNILRKHAADFTSLSADMAKLYFAVSPDGTVYP